MVQTSLLGSDSPKQGSEAGVPLADRVRPSDLDGFVGQQHLLGEGRVLRNMIEQDKIQSMIFWGPPGVGKTTLAGIIANRTKAEFVTFSAVTGGIKEVKAVMSAAEVRRRSGGRTVLFVDEIHRFNKAQQDAFLPYVEKGSIVLIGATTENPSFEINSALLSRCKVFVLNALSPEDISVLLRKATADPVSFPGIRVDADDEVLGLIAGYSNGDARMALNTLDAAVSYTAREGVAEITRDSVAECISRKMLLYDKNGEEHYNIISALHKSMRNSDPDAAVYWLARMLVAGEDPVYVARRLIEFSGDDVGLADPNAMTMAVSCFEACRDLGMPECRYALAETVVYLSMAPRSNSVAAAIDGAMSDASKMIAEPVPLRIRNAPTKLMESLGYGKDYEYAEATDDKITRMQCLPDSLAGKRYYEPGDRGNEVYYRKRLDWIREWRAGIREDPPK